MAPDRRYDDMMAVANVLQAGKIIVAADGNDRDGNQQAGLNPNGLALLRAKEFRDRGFRESKSE